MRRPNLSNSANNALKHIDAALEALRERCSDGHDGTRITHNKTGETVARWCRRCGAIELADGWSVPTGNKHISPAGKAEDALRYAAEEARAFCVWPTMGLVLVPNRGHFTRGVSIFAEAVGKDADRVPIHISAHDRLFGRGFSVEDSLSMGIPPAYLYGIQDCLIAFDVNDRDSSDAVAAINKTSAEARLDRELADKYRKKIVMSVLSGRTQVERPECLDSLAGSLVCGGVPGPCVYFLCYEDDVVYVGQSVNIYNRIGSHMRDKWFLSVFCLPVDRETMTDKENEWIHRLHPESNSVCVLCSSKKEVEHGAA